MQSFKSYCVTIVMEDGSRAEHVGLYESGCKAIVVALTAFPYAARVSARPVACGSLAGQGGAA